MQPKRAIQRTKEFNRIFGLPKRQNESIPSEFESLLRTPRGTMSLRPVQIQSLWELGHQRGLFGPQRVGCGKTLLSLLAPLVVQAKRPFLLVPAALVEKTERDRRILSAHWRIPLNVRVYSYEMLSRVRSEKLLEQYKPDLIVADEVHKLKGKRAGVTRRVARYMRERPETMFVGISGTIISHGIRDFAHVLRWCLKENAPIPATEDELDIWSDALDEGVHFLSKVDASIMGPRPREAFRDRLLSTPGVVASLNEDVSASLNIAGHILEPSNITEANFRCLRDTWSTPDGWTFSEAALLWMYARQLSLGLHYAWDPRPPQEWMNARRDWHSFVRETIAHSRTLDTEMHVALAVDKGDLCSPELQAWRAVRDSFRPNPVPVWHDEVALSWCARWLKEPGICWVEHAFFGNELSRRTGIPYYREEGKDDAGRYIEDASGPIIASVAANSTGRNLQHKWSKNLIVAPMAGAKDWEQLLGRTHRIGQQADEVTVDVLFGCRENFDSWEKAIAQAEATKQLTGQEQKILLATVDVPSIPKNGAAWKKVPMKSLEGSIL